MMKILKILRGVIFAAVMAVTGAVVYYNESLPDSYLVSSGNKLSLGNFVKVCPEEILPANYAPPSSPAKAAGLSENADLTCRREQLRLFGIFPIKTVTVREVDEPVVVPCGTPFGIKLITDGVMVVEVTGFDSGGQLCSPAKDAGLDEGDIIVSISGKKVSSNRDVSEIIESSGGKLLGVEYIREGQNRVAFIRPGLSAADGCYRAGMWVRDSSAGIGTVTFYDPVTHVFAGLGHPVCDTDTGEVLTMSEGQAAEVIISGVKKSRSGYPGELVGMFTGGGNCGSLLSNSESGLYGCMDKCPSSAGAVRVAMRQEITAGPADIYATVNGGTPERFSVEIEKISLSGGSHDMVVRVTDERLLEKAGGIVQGMSGSPIIQNGKLAGAVTHVLVRDPTRGYGIFADTMLEEARKLGDTDRG